MPSAAAASARRRRARNANKYQSGLAFATVFVQFSTTRAASIAKFRKLSRRKQGGKPGGGDSSDTDSDDTDDSDTDDDGPPPTKSVSHSSTRSLSSSMTATGSASRTASQTVAGVGSSSTQASSSSNTGASQSLPSQDAIVATELKRPISTGGIVGAVLGSFIIAGLIIMLLARCVNRARKARKRPQGFIPTSFFNVSPHHSELEETQPIHQTEMSQTQFSPLLIAPAVAAGATSSPSPSPYSRYSSSWASSNPTSTTSNSNRNRNTASDSPPSLSPQILAGSLRHNRSVGSGHDSEQERTSAMYTSTTSASGMGTGFRGGSSSCETTSSIHEPLQSPYESPPYSPHSPGTTASTSTGFNSGLPMVAAAAQVHDQAGLHRSMVAYQKSLEANGKADEGHMETFPSSNDPPPRYDA
ncbi:hypothetical protein D9613_000238 [Agrocybe pediades]|uniref:Uncharacterized protein n=1 Tax=Agrocybe pediades TaxID=84607 RepID=A0A8H4QZZ0_9AGAR|nr:hypothetical protein D9613_000238 [Agrocybe pediades]